MLISSVSGQNVVQESTRVSGFHDFDMEEELDLEKSNEQECNERNLIPEQKLLDQEVLNETVEILGITSR